MANGNPVEYIMGWIIVIACAVSGLLLTEQLMPFLDMTFFKDFAYKDIAQLFLVVFIGGMFGAILGWVFRGKFFRFVNRVSRKLELELRDTTGEELVGGLVGIVAGLVIANLFTLALWQIPYVGVYLPIALNIACAYTCGSIAKKKGVDILRTIKKVGAIKNGVVDRMLEHRKLVDTSVIIDGRIEDVFKTGFIDGVLVIPHFVIKELQQLADSADDMKRAKGRMALDTLNRLRQDYGNMIKVDSRDYNDLREVDLKLLRLAQETKSKILTVDYNLNKIAILHGIFVLNVNELANAIKTNIANGDVVRVKPVKVGKEPRQSVCYLSDGTMIVIEDGRDYIGQEVDVVVHSVFQTPAGRMIFSRIKQEL